MSAEQVRFERLGALLMDNVPAGVERAFLYAELEDGVIALSAYFESGVHLFRVEPSSELFDEIYLIQGQFSADVKAFEFEVKDQRFSADFCYADGFDRASDKPTRTKVALRRRFGRDSVVY